MGRNNKRKYQKNCAFILKEKVMRSQRTLGFLVSAFGSDGYFKYCKLVKSPSKSLSSLIVVLCQKTVKN